MPTPLNLERVDLSERYLERHRSFGRVGMVVLVLAALISAGNLALAWMMLPV